MWTDGTYKYHSIKKVVKNPKNVHKCILVGTLSLKKCYQTVKNIVVICLQFSRLYIDKYKHRWWVQIMATVNRDKVLKDASLNEYKFMKPQMPFSIDKNNYTDMIHISADGIPSSQLI